jgi:N4-gp56 family major capsid protein
MANTTNIPHAIASYYDRLLLEREKPHLVHALFGQVRNIPVGMSNTIKFRKYGALSVNTTALTEGLTPAGSNASVTDITAVAQWYGDYIVYTDVVTIESPDPVLSELTSVLGDQAGQSVDTIIRDVLVAGTNVWYSDATSPQVNAATSDVSATDVITVTDVRNAVNDLDNSNAKYITDFVSPDAGYLTTPVAPSYVGIVHPNVVSTIEGFTGFQSVEQYANKASIFPHEIGKVGRVRFIQSTQSKIKEGEGNGSIDVYCTLIFAKDAYGVTSINGNSMKMIVKPLGSSGSSDPLDQRGSIGWKANVVAKILNQDWMIRIEHALV